MALQPSSENELSSRSSSSSSKLQFYFLTLFPEIFDAVLTSSLIGKAQQKGLVSFRPIQIRGYATDKHHTVDDVPFGGGEGMLLKADVLQSAWSSISTEGLTEGRRRTILLSPQGRPLTQAIARELAGYEQLVLVCGRYEGVDERFIEACVDEELSVGDYVLTGGELPALVLTDVVTRLLPGVVGNNRSLSEESFEKGLLKYPQYTKPREFEGRIVPPVLLGGNHREISRWRQEQMEERTARKRPDLWAEYISGKGSRK